MSIHQNPRKERQSVFPEAEAVDGEKGLKRAPLTRMGLGRPPEPEGKN